MVSTTQVHHICLHLLTIFQLNWIFAEGFCLENVALGKPTFQPYTWHNGPPGLAVDGNNNDQYYDGSCSYAGGNELADLYWQVDLQAVYTIRAVTITNRADNNVWRLNNFDIDVYTIDPNDPGVTSEKCLTFPGSFGPVTRTLYCDSMVYGRYVRRAASPEDALTLCEVAVHAFVGGDTCDRKLKTPSGFTPQTDLYMNVSDFKKFSGSLMSCMVECFWLPVCDGFNFNGTGHGVGLCELIPIAMVGEPVTMSGWTFYPAICD